MPQLMHLLCFACLIRDYALVMPPLKPLPLPEGDIAPYPDEILMISGNRHLSVLGEVLTEDDPRWHLGCPVEVNDHTRRYWEGRAAVAGYTLAELLAEVEEG